MSIVKVRLVGGLCLAVAVVIINSTATQYVAERLSYHPALGVPLFGTAYSPFAWWQWAFSFYDHAPRLYEAAFYTVAFATIVCLAIFIVAVGLKSRSPKKHEGTHGTAHFATRKEIADTGLTGSKGSFPSKLIRKESRIGSGVYCGGYYDEETDRTMYLRHSGPEHVCVLAPTRAGKGVGLIIPTLLSELESVFVLDIKGENYAMTAGWRKAHAKNNIFRFDPATEGNSCSWNPLEEIRFGTRYQISDAQNIALMIIDDDGKGLTGSHWRTAAFELITGIILHFLYKANSVGRQPCILDCAYALSGVGDFSVEKMKIDADGKKQNSLAKLFQEMLDVKLPNTIEGQDAEMFIRSIGDTMGTKEREVPKEFGGILSTSTNALSLYKDPVIGANTSKSDFRIADLMDNDTPMSLYFIVDPDNLKRLKPLMRLLLTRIIVGLTGKMEFDNGRSKTTHKHRLLLMLDEFPALGKLDAFEGALAFIAGYGIKAYIITQDIQQLYQAYSQYQSIMSNCHIRIAFAPTELKTAEMISKMTGITTVITEQISTSGKRFGSMAGQFSRSYHSSQRALMTPDEVQSLQMTRKDESGKIVPGKLLIFVAGSPVIMGRQTPYFLDPTFNERSRIEPPKVSDTINREQKGFAAS